MKTPSQQGRCNKRKGKVWERKLAKLFAAAMPGADVKRGIGQSRSAGEVADVETPILWIEAKHGIQPSPRAALAQAQEAAPPGRLPVAVVKDDKQPPFVVMGLNDFLELVGEWWLCSNK